MVDELSGELAPPGWYHDATVEGHQRYWDGTAWTGPSIPIQSQVDRAAQERPAPEPPRALDTTLIFVLLGLLLVGGCGVVLVGVPRVLGDGGVNDDAPAEIMVTTTEAFAFTTTTGPPEPTGGAAFTTATTGGAGAFGLAYGSPMTTPSNVGSGGNDPSFWEISVDRPVDVTDEVMAANPLEPEPLDQVRFVAIPMTLRLLDSAVAPLTLDSPGGGLFVVFEGAASGGGYVPDTNTDDPFGCTAVVEPFPPVGEWQPGDSKTISVCVQLPTADLEHPDSRVVVWMDGGPTLTWAP